MIKSIFWKFLHNIDLSRHTNGERLLKIISSTHLVFLLAFVLMFSNESYAFYKKCVEDVEICPTFWHSVANGIAGVSFISVCVILVETARNFKQHTGVLLKSYCWWNAVALPCYLPFGLYMKAQFWHLHGLRIEDPFICSFMLIFKLYLIFHVFRIYQKLQSKLLSRWKEFQSGENDPEVCEIEGAVMDAEGISRKRVTNEDFKERILSPLSINIDSNKILGEGQFGTVYKGSFRHGQEGKVEIAAKVVKNAESGTTFQMLLQEIRIGIWVGDHPNIVKLYGISSDASMHAHFLIITEFCAEGCLEKFLQENRHTFVDMLQQRGSIVFRNQQLYINLELHGTHTSMDLIRFSTQVAAGMEHLANKKIVHGDLAARNILLTSDLTVKLTDFGMSRKLYAYQSYISAECAENVCVPWRWMSYETLKDLKFSEKSDVYSYGVVLWEIFSLGSLPFDKVNWTPDILDKLQSRSLKLERPAFASRDLFGIMQKCWSLDPSLRPTFRQIVAMLKDPQISTCCELNLKT